MFLTSPLIEQASLTIVLKPLNERYRDVTLIDSLPSRWLLGVTSHQNVIRVTDRTPSIGILVGAQGTGCLGEAAARRR
jgi:hypothetical protein